MNKGKVEHANWRSGAHWGVIALMILLDIGYLLYLEFGTYGWKGFQGATAILALSTTVLTLVWINLFKES
jgi:hypothetical protein